MHDGDLLGPYRIERELGAGGMGTVYSARVLEPAAGLEAGRGVAIKIVHAHLLDSADAVVRFRREVDIGTSVAHPNVVRTFGGGRSDGRHFLVMELVEGQTLAALRRELDQVPEELCRHIGREIARGLAAIHAVGAVHRDIKPENVLITPDNVVKIMDLGVARVVDEAMRLSQTGAFVGSVHYAAPECFSSSLGPQDHRVDLHALGLVLYELSTGDAPYAAPDVHGSIRRVLDERPRRLGELNPQASPFFEDVVHTLLVKDPRGRFATATDVVRVLDRGEDGEWWHTRARALRTATRRPLRRIRIPRETSLYGREAELAMLEERCALAVAGEGQVILIEGEAGIGKSRLVDEFVLRRERAGDDVNFVFGGYPPGGAATASGAFSTAYREQFGEPGSTDYLPDTPILVPAFDALLRGDGTPPGAQPLTKGSLQTCFVHSTRALAAERPTIVLIEDLHFAPEDGRSLFTALAMAVPGHRVLLIGTARRGMSKEWSGSVTRLAHARTLQVDRLGPKDLYAMLLDALRSERLADRLAGQIGRKSDGNPFFVFEILRGLREGQRITRGADGGWVSTAVIDEIEIPSSVIDLIEARVIDLSDEERELLEVAACCGFEFDGTLVADALGEQRIPVFRRLGRLEKKHRLVRASGRRHVFDHHQVRDVLYEGMSEVLREEYHLILGEALEARGGTADVDPDTLGGANCLALCEHFLGARRPERADRYLTAAARHLEAGYLHDHAISLVDRVLVVPGLIAGVRRARLLRKKAMWLTRYGRSEEERLALDEALALADLHGNVTDRARTRQSLSNHCLHRGVRDDAQRHMREALDLAIADGDRSLEGAMTNALATTLYFLNQFDDARRLYTRHVEIADELGDLQQLAMAKSNLGLLDLSEARYDEAHALFEETLELATRIGDRHGQSVANSNLGGIAYNRGRWAEARAKFELDLATCRELGDRRSEIVVIGNLGVAVRALGLYAEARSHHNRYLDLAEELGDVRPAAGARGMLATMYSLLGDEPAAQHWLDACIASAAEVGDRRTQAWAQRRQGDLHALFGRPVQAIPAYERSIELARDIGLRGLVAESSSQCAAAHLAAGSGASAQAAAHLDEASKLADEIGSPWMIVLAACRRARLLGESPDAAVAAMDAHAERIEVDAQLHMRFLLWRLTGDDEHLVLGRRLLDHLCAHAPPEFRASMVEHVPLNRAVRDGDATAPIE